MRAVVGSDLSALRRVGLRLARDWNKRIRFATSPPLPGLLVLRHERSFEEKETNFGVHHLIGRVVFRDGREAGTPDVDGVVLTSQDDGAARRWDARIRPQVSRWLLSVRV